MLIAFTSCAHRQLPSAVATTIIVSIYMPPTLAIAATTTPVAQRTTQSSRGWICNAYGRTGTWVTHTGAHKATKEAAQQDALAYCREDAFACQLSGCWFE